MPLPGAFSDELVSTTIDYSYDDLYRLSETTDIGTTTYAYDNANRLIDVNGQSYTWDDNGNLINDGNFDYTYDTANRLTALPDGTVSYTYAYNGMGDRYHQAVDAAPMCSF